MSHSGLTKRAFLSGCACCAAGAAFAATSAASTGTFGVNGLPTLLELGTDPMARIGASVWVAMIAPHVWLHTTTAIIPGGAVFPANGLILERTRGSLLIDTGYTPEQAELLWEWSKANLSSPIVVAVATHFHNDRTGGIEGLKKHHVHTFAYPLTCDLAAVHGMPVPEPIAEMGEGFVRFNEDCELFYPGAGHTRDNIVAWLPDQQVLFGGCLLKSTTSGGLGNTADSIIPDWAASIRAMQTRYPSAKITVPGHGTITGDPAEWTLGLLGKKAS